MVYVTFSTFFKFSLQVIGWSMWFAEYLFLERNWAKDENTLKVNSHLIYTSIHGILVFIFILVVLLLFAYSGASKG
jgi:1-acyl-sn-glycerol-3-phosphate acyltransferase